MAEQQQAHEALNVEEALTQSEAFLEKNKKSIIAGILIVVLAVAGIVYYNNYADAREQKAQTALQKGQSYIEADAYELALSGDSIGYAGLQSIIDEFGGTDAANLAHAYMGICYAHTGKYDEAVKAFDEFSAKDQMVSPAIIGAMGDCYAQLGNLDKAVDAFEKAAKTADNNTLSPIYLMKAAEIYMKQGKTDAAVKAYTTIKEKYFRSYQAADIDKYIERANLAK